MTQASFVIVFGIFAMTRFPADYLFAVLDVPSLAIATASAGAMTLGLGLRTLTVGSIDLISPTVEESEGNSSHLAYLRAYPRYGGAPFLLCSAYAGIGLVAIVSFHLNISGFVWGTSVSSLWFLASVVLFAVGVFGGSFLQEFLPLVGLREDSFHLLRRFAALTSFFSNPLYLAVGFVAGGVLTPLFLFFPFGLCPLLGMTAFRRIYRMGSQLVRMNATWPDASSESGKPVEPLGPDSL